MPNADTLRIEVDAVDVRHLAAVGSIPGVAPLLAAARNGPGIGQLLSGEDAQLSWRAPGSATFGEPVACSPDGEYVLGDGEDSNRWLRVDVHGDWLVPGSQGQVVLTEVYNNGVAGDDVAAAEAQAGCVVEYQVALRNAGERTLWNLAVWLDAASDARTALSLDGVNWFTPSNEGDALVIPTLEIGQSATLYARRTIAPTSAPTPKQRVHWHVTFDRPL